MDVLHKIYFPYTFISFEKIILIISPFADLDALFMYVIILLLVCD